MGRRKPLKAILVIDEMPTNCYECNYAIDLCHGTIPPQKYYNKRPSWCPLKPMPERKEQGYPTDDYTIGKADGWNACLKEIEK